MARQRENGGGSYRSTPREVDARGWSPIVIALIALLAVRLFLILIGDVPRLPFDVELFALLVASGVLLVASVPAVARSRQKAPSPEPGPAKAVGLALLMAAGAVPIETAPSAAGTGNRQDRWTVMDRPIAGVAFRTFLWAAMGVGVWGWMIGYTAQLGDPPPAAVTLGVILGPLGFAGAILSLGWGFGERHLRQRILLTFAVFAAPIVWFVTFLYLLCELEC